MATRKMEDLVKELAENGIAVPNGAKLSKDAAQVLLRDFYWNRDHKDETMPNQYDVMLAANIKDIAAKDEERGTKKAEQIWASPQWVAQLKLDGCRIVEEILADKKLFPSRNISVKDFLFSDKAANLPFHTGADTGDNVGTTWDGEMIAPYAVIDTSSFGDSKGTVTTAALQACAAILNCGPEMARKIQEKYGPLEENVFDILKYKGESTVKLPYRERLKLLGKSYNALPEATRKLVKLVPIMTDSKEIAAEFEGLYPVVMVESKKKFYEDMVAQGQEGIMLKDLNAPYEEGKRSKAILKAKRFEDVDAFVVGFIPGDEKNEWRDLVGGLVFAVLNSKGEQHIIGCVGSMTLEYRKSITKKVAPYQVSTDEEMISKDGKWVSNTSPAKNRTIDYAMDESVLGKVAVIRGQEFTKNIRLKHCNCPDAYTKDGVWCPYRTDKAADACTLDIEAIRKKVLSGERE